MKKFSLIGVLLLFIIGTIGCESVVQEVDYDTCYEVDYDNDEDTCYEVVTITGKIISTAVPCPPEMACPDMAVLAIVVNNTTYFFPRGFLWSNDIKGYSRGDIITVRGKVFDTECGSGREVYFLEIIEIIE